MRNSKVERLKISPNQFVQKKREKKTGMTDEDLERMKNIITQLNFKMIENKKKIKRCGNFKDFILVVKSRDFQNYHLWFLFSTIFRINCKNKNKKS